MVLHWNVAGLLCVYHHRCHCHFLVKPRHWEWGVWRGEHVGRAGFGPFFLFCWFK
jgi:hypothetical protein